MDKINAIRKATEDLMNRWKAKGFSAVEAGRRLEAQMDIGYSNFCRTMHGNAFYHPDYRRPKCTP